MTERVTVQSPAGTITGRQQADGGRLFAGVPFAQPPVGRLRFQPPQPLPDPIQEVDATAFAPAPPQAGTALQFSSASGPSASGGGDDALRAAASGTGALETSEDCLYLNVWTRGPADPATPRPVLVWLYGGGFDVGSASPPFTDGERLARLADVVVVAANYRVGVLGFGYWAGVGGPSWARSSNLGLQDQVAALRWVRRNIAAFGGDPANITVAGESAGAFCLGALLTAPGAQGAFDKAILHSGSTRRVFPVETADRMARDVLQALGVAGIEQLLEVDVADLLRVQSQVVDSDLGARNLRGGRSWGIVVDGVVVPDDPHKQLRRGGARNIPLLVGANRDEATIFARMIGAAFRPMSEDALTEEMARSSAPDPAALLAAYRSRAERTGGTSDLADLRAAFLTDAVYRRSASEVAAAQAAAGGSAWAYLFSATPMGTTFGAFHGADLAFSFDRLAQAGDGLPGQPRSSRRPRRRLEVLRAFGRPGVADLPAGSRRDTRQIGAEPGWVAEPPNDEVVEAWPLV